MEWIMMQEKCPDEQESQQNKKNWFSECEAPKFVGVGRTVLNLDL